MSCSTLKKIMFAVTDFHTDTSQCGFSLSFTSHVQAKQLVGILVGLLAGLLLCLAIN